MMLVMGTMVASACAPSAATVPPPGAASPAGAVRPGLDVLVDDSLHLVRGRRVGLVTNQTGLDAHGVHGVERLRAGRVVGMFPEGGIRAGATSIFEGAAPKRGATLLARLAGVGMIPCVVLGTDRLYAPRSLRPGWSRTPVWIAIGAPFAVETLDKEAADACMTGRLRKLYADAIAQFALGPDDLPATPQRRKGRDAATPA